MQWVVWVCEWARLWQNVLYENQWILDNAIKYVLTEIVSNFDMPLAFIFELSPPAMTSNAEN